MKQLEFNCPYCYKVFYRKECSYKYEIKRNSDYIPYCSRKCRDSIRTTKIKVQCLNCNKTFEKYISEVKKHPNNFCSKSCSASYNNKNKTHGIKRSKLEIYLEEQIKLKYPDLVLECNSKSAINSELDFYFPDLKLAIEINGICHYKPIYGENKLNKIVNNDNQKIIDCKKLGIKLKVINTSSCTNLTQTKKDIYWKIVLNLIEVTRLERA